MGFIVLFINITPTIVKMDYGTKFLGKSFVLQFLGLR